VPSSESSKNVFGCRISPTRNSVAGPDVLRSLAWVWLSAMTEADWSMPIMVARGKRTASEKVMLAGPQPTSRSLKVGGRAERAGSRYAQQVVALRWERRRRVWASWPM